MIARIVFASLIFLGFGFGYAVAADYGKYLEDGKYLDENDEPTYNVKEDGTVDWYTYSGFRRYHSECHVCHGPDGLGSTYAPALLDSIKGLGYGGFLSVVAVGREKISASEVSKMPAFGDNPNVYCYLDDIYAYLLARADNVIPRGRPRKRDAKPEQAKAFENECRESS